MKPILIILVSLLFINRVDAQWSIKHLNEDLNNTGIVKFRNDSVGIFMGGYSTFLKTTDGGETWDEKLLNVNGEINFFDFQFVGDSMVFAVGVDRYTKVLSSGLIQSNDLGKNWERVSTFLQEHIQSVWFFNKDSGLVNSYKGIYRTIDAGTTWDTVWSISDNYKYGEVKQLFFPTPECGYAIGIGRNQNNNPLFDNFLLKSYDSGATWDTVKTFYQIELVSVYFINQDTGFVGTDDGLILKTVDGGLNWTETLISEFSEIRSIQFISETNGFAVGGNERIYVAGEESNLTNKAVSRYNFIVSKTINGGKTWLSYDTVGLSLSSVYFLSDTVGFVSGNYELIMKSNGIIDQLPDDYPWHLNLSDETAIEEIKLINTEIKVYPNPVHEILTIQFANFREEIKSVSLINSIGQTLETQKSISNSRNIRFDMSGYVPGIYFIRAEIDDKIEFGKVIKN